MESARTMETNEGCAMSSNLADFIRIFVFFERTCWRHEENYDSVFLDTTYYSTTVDYQYFKYVARNELRDRCYEVAKSATFNELENVILCWLYSTTQGPTVT